LIAKAKDALLRLTRHLAFDDLIAGFLLQPVNKVENMQELEIVIDD